MAVSIDNHLLLLILDEVEDDSHKDGQAVHQMPSGGPPPDELDGDVHNSSGSS